MRENLLPVQRLQVARRCSERVAPLDSPDRMPLRFDGAAFFISRRAASEPASTRGSCQHGRQRLQLRLQHIDKMIR
jgi:hypothetical protein